MGMGYHHQHHHNRPSSSMSGQGSFAIRRHIFIYIYIYIKIYMYHARNCFSTSTLSWPWEFCPGMGTQPSQGRIFQSMASHSQEGGGEQHPVPSLERCC